LFWSVSAICVLIIIIANTSQTVDWPKALRVYLFASIFILVLSKVIFSVFLLTDDIIRGVRYTLSYFSSLINSTEAELVKNPISRSEFLVRTGLIIGSIPFFSLIYGMVKGAYDYQVRNIKIKSSRLGASFHKFRIVQISDLHLGSFNTTEPLKKAIELIQDQKPDLIVFSGDLVNNTADETYRFKELLKTIKAPYGVYSVLGNHDYGDYVRWNNQEEKNRNLEELINMHRQSGWNILMDQNAIIEKGEDRINIIGVQNWSAQGRFKRYGDLAKANQSIDSNLFSLLISHDPSHWKEEVIENYQHIDLTLSGHTHGFQFGIDIPGFKWSPVQYVYKEWAGLYNENKQQLYVNRGLGFLGYPGRVGILPEITVFELESENLA